MECDKLIVNYLQYYAKKNNKNFYIIPKSNKNNLLFRSREKEYFENLSKDEIKFLDFDNCLSSYHATDFSDVVVSVDSSLGYESLSRGNKTVFFFY